VKSKRPGEKKWEMKWDGLRALAERKRADAAKGGLRKGLGPGERGKGR
jgi:hypothetical protein